MPLKILFCVQGEGRGHMTQAISLAGLLRTAGHEVVATLVGNADGGDVPAFFRRRMQSPVITFASPAIRLNEEARELDVGRTLMTGLGRLTDYASSLRRISQTVADFAPDVVVNFYEPLTGVVKSRTNVFPPVVCIAHQ
ncbi:MAG: UDP- glucuronosyltransferase, partial [Rhodothermales bacterium]|nr:UDP- glucuronosyltransferase [Rhodothermales bacterium]